jgi:hypothetical protein
LNAADTFEWKTFGNVRHRCIEDYSNAAMQFPFLAYKQPSLKEMLIGNIGGYGGFSGYLNPFTGEAQLNGNLPGFLRPYVTCHEIGHQLGYAAEEEANMVGYLVGRKSSNPHSDTVFTMTCLPTRLTRSNHWIPILSMN